MNTVWRPTTCELCPPSYGWCAECHRCGRHCECAPQPSTKAVMSPQPLSALAPRQMIDGKPKKFASDPVDVMLAEEARQDHAKAGIRGERALFITDRVLTSLVAQGVTIDPAALRPLFLNAVIDVLYPGVAVDLPRYR